MSVRRIAITAALAAGALLLATATSAAAGAAPDQPTGYVSSGYCVPNGASLKPVSYVDMGNWSGRNAHRFVVKNNGRVVKDVTLSSYSGTSFMLNLATAGVTKATFALSMTIDGKAARDGQNKVLPVVKGKVDCAAKGLVYLYLGEHKAGFCFNGITAIELSADSTMLNGKAMKLTYTLDGVTRTATVPAYGTWSKVLAVAPGNHRITIAGTGYKVLTFTFKITQQCPAEG